MGLYACVECWPTYCVYVCGCVYVGLCACLQCSAAYM